MNKKRGKEYWKGTPEHTIKASKKNRVPRVLSGSKINKR